VAFLENVDSKAGNIPKFKEPVFFKQHAHEVKFGALITPFSCDWDEDGDEDLICGNTAGYIGFIENLDGGNPPRWAEPVYLKSNDRVIRIEAGDNGSIQGPCEAKWGYTTLSVADWDHDGRLDIMVNSILGKVIWYRNIGETGEPVLAEAQAVEVHWQSEVPKPSWNWWDPQGNELVTQWRTTPFVLDWNDDGLNDLIMLDHQGYLAFYEREKNADKLRLLPGKRVFYEGQNPLQLNAKSAGKSGRRKFCIVDWDLDGDQDILVNSRNINVLINVKQAGFNSHFKDEGEVIDYLLAGHTTSPTIVDWDRNNIPDLLIGAEDGFLYYLKNPKAQ